MPDSKLIVMVISGDELADKRLAWLAASQAGIARAYAEEEPDHSNAVPRVDESIVRPKLCLR
jgi:hypothetical protein